MVYTVFTMIERDLVSRLRALAGQFPAITLTGPRQSGKSTLCRAVFPRHGYANLEVSNVRALAKGDPRAFLAQFKDGAILDEIQQTPELISDIQGLIDEAPTPGRWVLMGSQNLLMLESVSQSLAGRTAVHHVPPRKEANRIYVYRTRRRSSDRPPRVNRVIVIGSGTGTTSKTMMPLICFWPPPVFV